MKRITAEQVMTCPGRLIDVRGVDEFASERLARAECVPLNRLAATASSWDRNECLILMCRSGVRSAQAVETLEHMGFKDLTMLDGGIEACKKAGVDVIRESWRIPIYRQVMVVAGTGPPGHSLVPPGRLVRGPGPGDGRSNRLLSDGQAAGEDALEPNQLLRPGTVRPGSMT